MTTLLRIFGATLIAYGLVGLGLALLGAFIFWLRKRLIARSLMGLAGAMGLLATTPEQVIENNLSILRRDGEERYRSYLHTALFPGSYGAPKKEWVKQAKRLGMLKVVAPEHRALFPRAKYELADATWMKVFFHRNLTFAGVKDYSPEIEAVMLRALSEKRLTAADTEFLRKTWSLFDGTESGFFGGPGFPYPDARYHLVPTTNTQKFELYFDDNFELVVAKRRVPATPDAHSRDEIVWERPGARQPER